MQQSQGKEVLVTVSIMLATIMQVLDTTIANVALPHMQGSLSASMDQITWVLTSYIVASAIMTLPVGYLSRRFGRRKLFLWSVAGFTLSSMFCGQANNLNEMIFWRLAQGVFGASPCWHWRWLPCRCYWTAANTWTGLKRGKSSSMR
tara:strand:- start:24596 stop:25036 length:441 start_codon:yes stop_codon:yes gene_type:complete